MKRSVSYMVTAAHALEKVINASPKKPTPAQAREILRNCGIMNSKNQVKTAYKTMVAQSRKTNAGK